VTPDNPGGAPIAPGHRGRWMALAVALLLVGGACLTAGLFGSHHPLGGPAHPGTLGLPSTVPVGEGHGATLTAARSVPTELHIPAIGLAVSLASLGLNADGTVEVPTDAARPGWFRLGPTPGQSGSAVILGHVDSTAGPAVFFELRSLAPGDVVDVGLADGVTAVFDVTSVAMYPKADFPADQVYGSSGTSELQLVTCGGTFDPGTGHYLSNIVVYSSLVATIPAGG